MAWAGHCLRTTVRCVTSQGYIGSVPLNTKIGDKVAIPAGCKAPFLLREEDRGRYYLVGDCYIHGIMDGEAWDETRVKAFKIV